MSTQKAVKLGRKPRAGGIPMSKLGIAIQQPLRDALDLIARDRKTSLSQAVEFLITEICKTYRIEGRNPLELVDHVDQSTDDLILAVLRFTPEAQLDDGKPDFVSRRVKVIKRWLTMPESLRTRTEQYFCELLAALPELGASDGELVALEEASLWLYQNSISVERAMQVWRKGNAGTKG